MRPLFSSQKRKVLLLNGATGTNLLDKGLAPGESPSILNVRAANRVYAIQRAYVDAGSDIILTNTFSANPFNIPQKRLKSVLRAGARIAQRAAKKRTVVLGDIGPLGELVEPYGDLSFEKAFRIFKSIAGSLYASGIKGFFIETFTSMIEAKAAFLAAREYSNDVFVCFSLQDNGYTLMGECPEAIALTFEALGAKGVGINCTLPAVACRAIQHMSRVVNVPLIVKPNAGSIEICGTSIKHSMTDRELARYYSRFVKAGANIIGGCCGTTPEYIALLNKKSRKPNRQSIKSVFRLVSTRKAVSIEDARCLIVGERLNPSGRKRIKSCLSKKDYSIYAQEAKLQENAGADLLDVNAYIAEEDEKSTLYQAVMEVVKSTTLPLFIDTQNLEAALQVMRAYPGIGVLNSIPARRKELRTWLPYVRKYGFKAVISLIGRTIPRTVAQRLQNVSLALGIARDIGMPRQDLIFDPLVFAAATDSEQITITLETVRQLDNRGLKTVLGISNVSFGLPARSHLNAALISSAIHAGVTFLIVNPLSQSVQQTLHAAGVLYKGAIDAYIGYMRQCEVANTETVVYKKKKYATIHDNIIDAIAAGDVVLSTKLTTSLIESKVPAQEIIDTHIAQALKKVGDGYESGKLFIPDLRKAADAAKGALDVIKRHLPKNRRKGTILLATVKGDIHDIGKNIAGMVFESAGFKVIDLGKDVAASKIVQNAKKFKPDIIGLSALLTTTMPEMGRVIKRLREENLNTKVIIGGPNVSNAYAKKIGAFGAARTVLEGLRLLQRIM